MSEKGDRHSTHSVLRERIVEHIFVGEVLRALWQRGVIDVEVLRSEFDAYGYDIVLSRGRIVRHIQLKTQAYGSLVVAKALAQKPSGCVVWIGIDKETLQLGPFLWFGGRPGRPLPDISQYQNPRRAMHNAKRERPLRKNHHQLPRVPTGWKSEGSRAPDPFTKVATVDAVISRLFGNLRP